LIKETRIQEQEQQRLQTAVQRLKEEEQGAEQQLIQRKRDIEVADCDASATGHKLQLALSELHEVESKCCAAQAQERQALEQADVARELRCKEEERLEALALKIQQLHTDAESTASALDLDTSAAVAELKRLQAVSLGRGNSLSLFSIVSGILRFDINVQTGLHESIINLIIN
jgi:hypothetical protein